jgi:DNA-binding NtrC family response regulator
MLGLIASIPAPPATVAVSPARQLHAELAAARMQLRERFGSHNLVVRSPAMQRPLEQLQLAQACAVSVLLTGEAGTGREHLARHIHFGSPAKALWFVPLDCRRLDPQDVSRVVERLQEVHRTTSGGGAAPHPGTLFLADVESLPRDLQEQIVVACPEDD